MTIRFTTPKAARYAQAHRCPQCGRRVLPGTFLCAVCSQVRMRRLRQDDDTPRTFPGTRIA